MATVKTIKTDGTGDYTTLQAWEIWADDQGSAAQWAECYDIGDMGSLTISGWTTTPDATDYPRVYTPLAERHTAQANTGAYLDGSIQINEPYTRVEGLRIIGTGFYGIYGNVDFDNAIVDSNLVMLESAEVSISFRVSSSITRTVTIRNNIVYSDGSYGIEARPQVGDFETPTLTAYIYNNLVRDYTSGSTGIICEEKHYGPGTPTLHATVKNNIVAGNYSSDYWKFITNGSMTADYNLSSDDTGDDFGGTHNIINMGPGNLFVNTDSDWHIQEESPLLNAGTTIAGFDWDCIHVSGDNWRPQGSAWDMGPVEAPPGLTHRTRAITLSFPVSC
jgi:hypothetical protein